MKIKISQAMILMLALYSGALAQEPFKKDKPPEYDYRVVNSEQQNGSWLCDVRKVLYYPGTDKERILDIATEPATVGGAGMSKKAVKRELILFAMAAARPVLVFPMVVIEK